MKRALSLKNYSIKELNFLLQLTLLVMPTLL